MVKMDRDGSDTWWTRWRDEYQTVHHMMHDAQTLVWMRLMGRFVGAPAWSYAELVRGRTLIETLYADRANQHVGSPWIDARTRLLITSSIRSLPDHERALAQYELSMLDIHDRDRHRLRVKRWTLWIRLASVPIGFLLLWLNLEGLALVVSVLTVLVSYLVDTMMWCRTYLTLRQIWRAYSALGAPPLSGTQP